MRKPILSIPDVRQKDTYDCGPACVKAVCQFYGKRLSLSEVAAGLASSPTDGTDPRTIERFLRNAGYKVLSGEMDLSDLKANAKAGRPTIAILSGHYVVVCGLERKRVYFHDPLSGARFLSLANFYGQWRDHDRLQDFKQWGIAVWC